MMSAKQAAQNTINALAEQNILNSVEDLILAACNKAEYSLHLSVSEVSKIFPGFCEADVSMPIRWPLSLRFTFAEMKRAGYDIDFYQYGTGWYLEISWKKDLVF